jgi:drug/metabolite transporter (DMT)-like permease
MLVTIYEMDVEKSSLFYILSGIAFLVATPVAFILRSRQVMRRRVILFMALAIMGLGCVVRTGNFTGK